MTQKMLCLDASLVIRYLGSLNTNSIYQQKWNQWQQEEITLVAPTLLMYEVSNGLHRAAKALQMTPEEAEEFLERALNLGIRFYGDSQLHREALVMAQRYNLPATYDAHYLALAQRLNLELWTVDERLFNSVKSSLEWVKLLKF